MKSSEGSKEANGQRRRKRPRNSIMDNFEAHTSTDIDHSSSSQARSHCTVLNPSERHHASIATLSIVTVGHIHAPITRSPAGANSPKTSQPRFSPDTRRQTGKCCALDEMIDHEVESTTMQPATLPGKEDPEGSAVLSKSAVEAETPRKLSRQESEDHIQAVTALRRRVSTRRTKSTTRWFPSMADGRHRTSKVAGNQRSWGSTSSAGLAGTPRSRPILNATQSITFNMLQPHFERPLQQAADSFCVCTTLLKKICRRNGITNWPYRKICGLRKSISSMAKQVNYLDGEQRRAYAAQLKRLEYKLQAYLRTGNEPTEERFQKLDAEVAPEQLKTETLETSNKNEEKEAQVVPAWSTRLKFDPPLTEIVQEIPILPLTAWGETDFHSRELLEEKAPAFPTTATHHQALPSIASILEHQNYNSPSRAASTQSPSTTAPGDPYYGTDERQQPQWRYFSPTNDDAT